MVQNKAKLVAGSAGGIAAAIALIIPVIQQLEGYRSSPYRDAVGVLTVCYGHTGPDIVPSKKYTKAECDTIFGKDTPKYVESVLRVTPGLSARPYQLAGAISFVYNLGEPTYKRSSVARNFNQGNWTAGCKWILAYDKAGGKYMKGLAFRRKIEYDICMKDL